MSRVAAVTCVWQRPERLRYTLDGLADQFHECDIVLINNNAELTRCVDRAVEKTDAEVRTWHNECNRGPFARVEVMHELRDEYEWFVFVDDDLNFDQGLVLKWMRQAEPGVLKSWKGFRFVGDYWQREAVEPGESCDYLLGSNMLIPAEALRDDGILELPDKYALCCDDLWLCYWASHVLGMDLQAGRADVAIQIDGRDTYLRHHNTKIRLLDELRAKGWDV